MGYWTRKVLTVTMYNVSMAAAALGLSTATLGFHFYRKLQLPQGMDDTEYMMISSLALGIFGLITFSTTAAGAYWLNNGSTQFKIAFCGTIAAIAYAVITIRGVLPQVEKIINNDMMMEYKEYFRDRKAQEIVDRIQREHECCGYFELADFPEYHALPDSCCSLRNLKKFGHCKRRTAFTDPCRYKLGETIDVYLNGMDTLCFATSSTLLAVILLTLSLVYVSRNEDSNEPYNLNARGRLNKF